MSETESGMLASAAPEALLGRQLGLQKDSPIALGWKERLGGLWKCLTQQGLAMSCVPDQSLGEFASRRREVALDRCPQTVLRCGPWPVLRCPNGTCGGVGSPETCDDFWAGPPSHRFHSSLP